MAKLTPQELSEREFTKVLRGYQPSEVDDFIEDLIENYTYLYDENTQLHTILASTEKQLALTEKQLALAKAKEEEVKNALENAKKAGDAALEEAYETSDRVLSSVRTGCDAILSEFRQKIDLHKAELEQLQAAVADFKNLLLDSYSQHLKLIDQFSPETAYEPVLPSDEYVSRIIYNMKQELAGNQDIAMETISSEDCLCTEDETFVSDQL